MFTGGEDSRLKPVAQPEICFFPAVQFSLTIVPRAFPAEAEKTHPDPEGYNRYVLDR
jgi:hypothetical protein